jgi:hypothetical protein
MDECPKTLPVPVAGRMYFGLGRNASYEAARRGEIPVIRIGGRLCAVVAALERMVSAGQSTAAAEGRLGLSPSDPLPERHDKAPINQPGTLSPASDCSAGGGTPY